MCIWRSVQHIQSHFLEFCSNRIFFNFNRYIFCFSESFGPWFHLLQDDVDTFEQCGCRRQTSIQTEGYKLNRLTKIRPEGPFLLSKDLPTTGEKLWTMWTRFVNCHFLPSFVQILTRDTKSKSTDQYRHNWLIMFIIRLPTDCSNMIKEENLKSYAIALTMFIDSMWTYISYFLHS